MANSRAAYWKSRNDRLRLAKLAAKATGNYPSLSWCLNLDDDALSAAYNERSLTPSPLRTFDRSPLNYEESGDAPKPWTAVDEAMDLAAQATQHQCCLRHTLFSAGVTAYVATLSEVQLMAQLKLLDPETFSKPNTRYTEKSAFQRVLCGLLYAKEVEA